MKHVGVREFRDRATGYLKGSEPLAVERHGKLIGFYIPLEPERGTTEEEEFRKALGRLDETVRRVLEESGMTEDELADSFDLGKRRTAGDEAGSPFRGGVPAVRAWLVLLAVDANILVSELLRARGRRLVEDDRLRLRVSAKAWEEARHELPKWADGMVLRGRLTRKRVDELLADGLRIAEARAAEVPPEVFASFEEEAVHRIPRDPDDVPTVALALALGGAEGRCGIPTWTTDTLLAHLAHAERERR